jgi:DNA mismatch repair protein PMS2
MIRAIDSSSIHKICSGQVVVDLCSAVKELVENALDAHATCIEINMKSMGLESIEVSDNGVGIEPKDYLGIALKHHTSKLQDFSDLDTVKSFGFRGEALNALCELSEKLLIVTKCAGDVVGAELSFSANGRYVS